MSIWLVGGLDPTGGAGVLRDHFTAGAVAPELSSHCVVTAWTRQGDGAPARPGRIDVDGLEARLRRLPPPAAVKLGLVPDPCVPVVRRAIAELAVPIVADPVMRASDGGDLGATPAALEPLLAIATVVTPNVPEAIALVGEDLDPKGLIDALVSRFPGTGVLLKGGHGPVVERVTDRFAVSGTVHELSRPRWPEGDIRGTGCALATAIACRLALGDPPDAAVRRAVTWLDDARRGARSGPDGRLHLPP